mgnify:CR=1 FL=1
MSVGRVISRLVDKYKVSAIVSLSVYLLSMVVIPLFVSLKENGNLNYLLSTWHSWQTFNAAILALISTGVVLVCQHKMEAAKEKRKLIAAMAYLPMKMRDFQFYINSCIPYLEKAYLIAKNEETDVKGELYSLYPSEPEQYVEVLEKCIFYAPDADSHSLAEFLRSMQICFSNLSGLREELSPDSTRLVTTQTVLTNMLSIIKLSIHIERLLNFARQKSSEFNFPVSHRELKEKRMLFPNHESALLNRIDRGTFT